MRTLFFIIFLAFYSLQAKSQDCIEIAERPDYYKVIDNAFSVPIDTLENRFNLIFTKKYPDQLQKHKRSIYQFMINVDSLGCIINVKSFPNQKIDNDLFNKIEDLLKYHYSCKKMTFKEENGEISTIRFFYFTIVFINSKIKISVG